MAMAAAGTRRELWRAPVALVGLTALCAFPYGLLGPGWLREDWGFLLGGRDGGKLGGWFWPFRPLAAVIHVGVFDGIGAHPLAVYALQAVVVGAVAVTLWSTLRRVVDGRFAFTAAALWIVLPTHSAIDQWASGFYICIALLLGLLGVRRELDGQSGALWFAAAGLTYEAVLVPVLVFLAVRRRWQPLAVAVGICAWATLLSPIESKIRVVPPGTVVNTLFGLGLGSLVAILVVAAVAMAWKDPMVRLGFGLAVVGILPFVPYGNDITLAGVGDRAMVTASIGVAIVLAALLLRAPRFLGPLVGVALIALMTASLTVDRSYAEAARQTLVALDCSTRLDAKRPIEIAPVDVNGVQGLVSWWDATPAVRYATRDPEARADTSSLARPCRTAFTG